MTQVNVNTPAPPPDNLPVVVERSHDRTMAALVNMATVLVVLVVLVALAYFIFMGPLRTITQGSATNVTVNPPAQQAPNVTINPPASTTH